MEPSNVVFTSDGAYLTSRLCLYTEEPRYLLEDQLHAGFQLGLCVNLQVLELGHEDVELLGTQLVQNAASLSQQNFDLVLKKKNKIF